MKALSLTLRAWPASPVPTVPHTEGLQSTKNPGTHKLLLKDSQRKPVLVTLKSERPVNSPHSTEEVSLLGKRTAVSPGRHPTSHRLSRASKPDRRTPLTPARRRHCRAWELNMRAIQSRKGTMAGFVLSSEGL